MAVEGVNSSNNNTALYTASGAVLGAGAGVATAYLTKPFLKDGAPTDSFIKKINENIVKGLPADQKKVYDEASVSLEKLKNVKNMEELKEVLANNEAVKAGWEAMGVSAEDAFAEMDKKGFEAAKAETLNGVNFVLDMKKDIVKGAFDAAWDADKKKFVHDASKLTKEGFEAVTSAAKSIQGKYAAIYGAIGAAVLGLGTFLCCGGKKAEKPEQALAVDTQA